GVDDGAGDDRLPSVDEDLVDLGVRAGRIMVRPERTVVLGDVRTGGAAADPGHVSAEFLLRPVELPVHLLGVDRGDLFGISRADAGEEVLDGGTRVHGCSSRFEVRGCTRSEGGGRQAVTAGEADRRSRSPPAWRAVSPRTAPAWTRTNATPIPVRATHPLKANTTLRTT